MVADTGSFTAASRRLHVSQSAVSRQIQSLEERLSRPAPSLAARLATVPGDIVILGAGGAVLYAAAKGFVSTVTHGWAKEVVGDGIRVRLHEGEIRAVVRQGGVKKSSDLGPLFATETPGE